MKIVKELVYKEHLRRLLDCEYERVREGECVPVRECERERMRERMREEKIENEVEKE